MNLAQKVELIRRELALEPSMPMAAAIRAANDAMGLAASGSLPAQCDALLQAMGVEQQPAAAPPRRAAPPPPPPPPGPPAARSWADEADDDGIDALRRLPLRQPPPSVDDGLDALRRLPLRQPPPQPPPPPPRQPPPRQPPPPQHAPPPPRAQYAAAPPPRAAAAATPPAPPPPPPSDGSWQCGRCTYISGADYSHCEMCGAAPPPPPSPSKKERHSGERHSGGAAADGGWQKEKPKKKKGAAAEAKKGGGGTLQPAKKASGAAAEAAARAVEAAAAARSAAAAEAAAEAAAAEEAARLFAESESAAANAAAKALNEAEAGSLQDAEAAAAVARAVAWAAGGADAPEFSAPTPQGVYRPPGARAREEASAAAPAATMALNPDAPAFAFTPAAPPPTALRATAAEFVAPGAAPRGPPRSAADDALLIRERAFAARVLQFAWRERQIRRGCVPCLPEPSAAGGDWTTVSTRASTPASSLSAATTRSLGGGGWRGGDDGAPDFSDRLGYDGQYPPRPRLCRFFEQRGTCRDGNRCTFAHGVHELMPSVNVSLERDEAMGDQRQRRQHLAARAYSRDDYSGGYGGGGYGDIDGAARRDAERKARLREQYENGGGAPYGGGERPMYQPPAHPRYKTRLCANFVARRRCPQGVNCIFAHGEEELNTPTRAPSERDRVKTELLSKTRICRHWERHGVCPSGSRCYFAHGAEELRVAGSGGGPKPVCLCLKPFSGCRFWPTLSGRHAIRPGDLTGIQPGGGGGADEAVCLPAEAEGEGGEEEAVRLWVTLVAESAAAVCVVIDVGSGRRKEGGDLLGVRYARGPDGTRGFAATRGGGGIPRAALLHLHPDRVPRGDGRGEDNPFARPSHEATGSTTLLGSLGQFCSAFFHANSWEAEVKLCLCWPADASGKKAADFADLTREQREATAKCSKSQVVVVARLVSHEGKTLYVARYANCFRGNSEANIHAEEFMLSDKELLKVLDGRDRSGYGGAAPSAPARLLLYMTYQPCHHSGGRVPKAALAREGAGAGDVAVHPTTCSERLREFFLSRVAPNGVGLTLILADVYKATWEEELHPTDLERKVYGSKSGAAREGMRLLLDVGVRMRGMRGDDWEYLVTLADDDVQREWERRGCLADGVAASRFTPVHLELRKGYDEYIGDYIDANWESGGGGDASLRRDLRSPVRLELAVDGASGAVGAALSYRAPRVRPPRVEKGAVRLSCCTTTAGRVWAVLELRASAFRVQ